MMSPVSAKSTSGLRSTSAWSGTAARSSARTSLSEPFTARPIGVRTASTMTASGMSVSFEEAPASHSRSGFPRRRTRRGLPRSLRETPFAPPDDAGVASGGMRLIPTAAACAAAALLAPTGAAAAVSGPFAATGASPFAANCNGAPQNGVSYRNTEVEPYLDLNPARPLNLVGVYQQDRFETGGANGLGTTYSEDGGSTWTRVLPGALPKFSRCAGAAPGSVGDYERATDPWVSIAPNGHAFQISVSFNDTRDLANAVLVSRSRDGGHTWGAVTQLIRDTANTTFNDKESITADFSDSRYVYATWD